MGSVSRSMEAPPEVAETPANLFAHRGGMFSNAAGKNEHVEAAQHGGKSADLLANGMAKHDDGLIGKAIGGAPGEQGLHVRRCLGDAQQAGFDIAESLQPPGVVSFFPKQMDQ